MSVCCVIVIDGLGVGAQEDAHLYGDEGSNTLGHVCAQTKCKLKELERLGLGNIIPLDSVPPVKNPAAAFGKMRENSPGKDSTTGHWEIAGIVLEKPFPLYPQGFPGEVIDAFCSLTGNKRVLANKPASGTSVINEYGEEHQKTKYPIVYTSADSVFQIACDVQTIPLQKLYEWCQLAREKVMIGPHAVGRVIARPFKGLPCSYERLSEQRHDYSLNPPKPFLPDYLKNHNIKTISIGKIIDLFGNQGFTTSHPTKTNAEGIEKLASVLNQLDHGFVFVNLIETDQNFGHRNDVAGYARALERIDSALPSILKALKQEDLLIITGDHGNDPTMPGTDHSREFVPLLVYPAGRANGIEIPTRESFTDISVSVCRFFGLESPFPGSSFISRRPSA